MRILQILYYYEPYTSGLTVYAARLANALGERGHEVTVLASRHQPSLQRRESTAPGVSVRRITPAFPFDRAVILPTLIPRAIPLFQQADVIHLHLPMAEAAVLVGIARMMGKRVVLTHHADLVLTASPLTRLAASIAKWSGILAGEMASANIVNTRARASLSPVTSRLTRVHAVAPPIVAPDSPADCAETFRTRHGWGARPVIGYVGRYTSEKGIDRLLAAIPAIKAAFPDALVALVGPTHDPRSGALYHGPWDAHLDRHANAIEQLDYLPDDDLARFYEAIDVLVLPSIDWTESFGMVQIEAMLRGTPVVASDLPGVDEPITVTGYGKLARAGDIADLAASVIEVLTQPDQYQPDTAVVRSRYGLDATIDAWEVIYRDGKSDR